MKNLLHNIYENGTGDSLVEESNYPEEIKEFLNEERILIDRLIKNYSLFVEVGCMTGRHAEQAFGLDKYYLGLDVIARYISEAKKTYQNYNHKVFFECVDILNFKSLFCNPFYNTLFTEHKSLLVFPFNSFGNTTTPRDIAKVLKRFKKDILICTYNLDLFSNTARQDYYEKSGFKNVTLFTGEDFNVFRSIDGLESKSFNNRWFLRHGFENIRVFPLGRIGHAVYITF